MQKIYRSKNVPGRHKKIEGIEHVDKVINIDQSPIGRTPRSNPATYTGVFDKVRTLFASTQESKVRGYLPGRFSFNVKGGRLRGVRGRRHHQDRDALPPRRVRALRGVQGSRAYNRDHPSTSRSRARNIAEVLELSIEGKRWSSSRTSPPSPVTCRRWSTSGLGYVRLGQPAPRSPAVRRSA